MISIARWLWNALRCFYIACWSVAFGSNSPFTRGCKVTFKYADWGPLVHARVAVRIPSSPDTVLMRAQNFGFIFAGKMSEQGLTWCYGWEGEAVDALRAVVALS